MNKPTLAFNHKAFYKQRGLSIVELMVALVLSLVVMFVTTSIYVSNKQTYRFLDQYSMLQENGRFAIYFLREHILQAGFPREVVNPFPVVPANDNTVTVEFRSAVDCLGAAITTVPPVTRNTFTVTGNALTCNGEVLVDGIQTMHVVYGVDTTGDLTANTYVTRGGVADWTNVVSVRIALLAVGAPNSLDAAQPITYNMNGYTSVNTNDATPRRIFNTTIPLRNRNKTII